MYILFVRTYLDNITWCHSKPIFYRISHEKSKCVEKWLDLFLNCIYTRERKKNVLVMYVWGKVLLLLLKTKKKYNESQLVLFNTFYWIFFYFIFYSNTIHTVTIFVYVLEHYFFFTFIQIIFLVDSVVIWYFFPLLFLIFFLCFFVCGIIQIYVLI